MNNYQKILAGSAAAAGGLALFTASGSYTVMKQMTGGKRQSYDEALAWQREHHDLSWFDAGRVLSYEISSFDGYILHAMYYPCPRESDRYIILTHGYTDNLYGSLKYAGMYLDLGFHCIAYDLRGHGENAPHICTYSILESRDLLSVIRDTRERYGDGIRIGLHGESLGAATTAAVLGMKPDVEFAVCDCGFSEIRDVIQGTVKHAHMPAYLADAASVWMYLLHGYSLSEMRPVDHLEGNTVPTLFIHGANDRFIPPWHSQTMHKKTAGYSEFHAVPGAGHAKSLETNPENYRRIVETFLRQIQENRL